MRYEQLPQYFNGFSMHFNLVLMATGEWWNHAGLREVGVDLSGKAHLSGAVFLA